MARTAKMIDVVVAGRMAKMRVRVTKPLKATAFDKTVETVTEAMRLSAEAEFNTQSRTKYRSV